MDQKTKVIEMLQNIIQLERKDLQTIIKPIIKKYCCFLSITKILEFLKIKRNTYYSWLKNEPKRKKRNQKKELITKRVGSLCKEYNFAFGYRKITFLYRKVFNEIINKKIILKIMKENDWLAKWRVPNSKNKFYEKFSQKNLI
ncbi:IS3 family transposase [Candidatus Phytoplasma sp. AldY-WA1]|uniref:IS3 family transposase n=1 Tax=Candidatus Phytoplasma sp. AldY-WA1 TaxID=2852100 RepID=UPI00254E342E|nr:IS3 family transposase [Candidatus Phytoplasma sp. AldY-WA1]